MKDLETVVAPLLFAGLFYYVIALIKEKLFENGVPREEAKRFIVERQSFLHPNLISSYGLFLAILAMLLYYYRCHQLAIVLYIAAAYFDFLDGAVARASGLGTEIGKELDPLFDKIKTLPPILYFGYQGCFPVWLAITFVCLDVVSQLIRPLIHFLNWKYELELSVAANVFGKIKTTLVSGLIVYCYLQLKVDAIPDLTSVGLWVAMTFAVLSIIFKFKEEVSSLKSLYDLIMETKGYLKRAF